MSGIRIATILTALLFISSCGDDHDQKMTFTGLVDANTVRVSAENAGRVLAIHADEGAIVAKGDTIAVVDTERLDHQATQQDALLSELELQRKAAVERRAAAAIQRENLHRKLVRFRALLAEHAVTQQSVDDLAAQLDATDAELRSADRSLAAMESKRAQILAGKGVIETQRSDAHILAPLSGTVLVRYVEAGEVLGPGSPVCEIADLGAMWTRVYLSAKQLAQVRLGQEVQVYMDGSDTALTGRVSWIADKAEFTPKSILTEETRASLVYAAKISVANPGGALKIGMPITVVVHGRD
ncbi:MAG: efflux RND transporter periplasmic adaptor subunit [Bacteroidia bacterium]|nr:efflux RND transporter periplasmic adaptor subunit [Bacteroidia bacterium]